jgi:enoyl-CoA hydratase/carnithine racemase
MAPSSFHWCANWWLKPTPNNLIHLLKKTQMIDGDIFMSFAEILFDVEDGIATITLNRPDKLNAWTGVMEAEVRTAMNDANTRDDVKVVILTGAGRGFCAGADMNNLADIGDGTRDARPVAMIQGVEDGLDLPDDFKQKVSYFPTMTKPVIAAINGVAAGLGLVMALYADVRFASDAARFTTAFAKRGLIAEHGISWMLPRLVGISNGLDMLLSSRIVEAVEAKDMGLVSKIYPLDELMPAVRAYAQDIAQNVSPRSTRVMKEQVYKALFSNLEEAIQVGNKEMVDSFVCEDFKEGVAHFMEKRPARFTGR